jgi:general secretion pathway protein A
MYEQFYNLRERPFDLTPNPRYLLLTSKHREALGNLEYGIAARKGVTVLTGDAGTGKTTLIRTAFARAESRQQQGITRWVHLKNPSLRPSDFYEFLAARLRLSSSADSKARLLDELEEIRLLANIETDVDKLLPVVLVGQPELAERLNDPRLRQLKQRVALRCTLSPLSLKETASYIAGRIEIAGGNPGLVFTREAVAAVYERSLGVPRTISVICDNALLTAFAEEQRPVRRDTVETVCRDFDLLERRTTDRRENYFR